MKHWGWIVGLCGMMAIAGCNNTPIIEVEESKEGQLNERLMNANKYIANSEETEIDGYVGRRGWPMEKMSNGCRIWEYEKGDGIKPEGDDVVEVRYRLEGLSGKTVYEEKMEEIALGHSETMVGLDSAVRRLSKGSKAKVIIPSAMAYGVVGDGEKIGARMVVVLDMEVIKIERKK